LKFPQNWLSNFFRIYYPAQLAFEKISHQFFALNTAFQVIISDTRLAQPHRIARLQSDSSIILCAFLLPDSTTRASFSTLPAPKLSDSLQLLQVCALGMATERTHYKTCKLSQSAKASEKTFVSWNNMTV
jgi:hypothetical protein